MKKKRITAGAAAAVVAISAFSVFPAVGYHAPEADISPEKQASADHMGISFSLPSLADSIVIEDGSPGFAMRYDMTETAEDMYASVQELPARFDLRESGFLTPVRDQSGFGTCWMHSAAASAESSIIRSDPTVDLSEFHGAFYSFYDSTTELDRDELRSMLSRGATHNTVTAMWTQWIGPVYENRMPYGDMSYFDDPEKVSGGKYLADYHLKDAYMFDYTINHSNEEQVDRLIKEYVMEGLAVDAAFYSSQTSLYSSVYKSSNSRKPVWRANHSVAIVGWDDDFPAESFIVKPDRNGAWLVKNSWGTGFGDGGYIWISYDDHSLGEFGVYVLDSADNYSTIYQHDTLPATQTISAYNSEEENGGSYMANIYHNDQPQQAEAVGTYIRSSGTEYEITIYTDLTDPDDPVSGTPSSVTTGVCDSTGFITLSLDEPVYLAENSDFAAVIKLKNENTAFLIPVETSLTVYDDETGELIHDIGTSAHEDIKNGTSPGQSFCSIDGVHWFDIYNEGGQYSEEDEAQIIEQLRYELTYGIDDDDETEMAAAEEVIAMYAEWFSAGSVTLDIGNIALKVYGNEPDKVSFSRAGGLVPEGEKIALSAASGEIKYTVNGGSEQIYTEPIVITEPVAIRATADGKVYSERSFEPETAQLNGLGYTAGNTKSSIKFAEKNEAGQWLIELDSSVAGIRLYPVSAAEIELNGEKLSNYALSDVIDIPPQGVELELELTGKNMPGSTAVVKIVKNYYTINNANGTITFSNIENLTAPDGSVISSGDDITAYAGQELTGTAGGESIVITVPEKAVLPELDVDFRKEMLVSIPAEYIEMLEYRLGTEGDFRPAGMRAVPLEADINEAEQGFGFVVIPGETVTLRVAGGNTGFGSDEVTYEIPEAPSAPAEKPEYSAVKGRLTIENDGRFEYASSDDSYSQYFSEAAGIYGYADTDEYKNVLKNRFGTSDESELSFVYAADWGTAEMPEFGKKFGWRYAATDTEFASKAAFYTYYDRGDTDLNGRVDAADATSTLMHYASLSTGGKGVISGEGLIYADFDGSGVIDASDASDILRYYAVLSTS